jgi:hypothetical protein
MKNMTLPDVLSIPPRNQIDPPVPPGQKIDVLLQLMLLLIIKMKPVDSQQPVDVNRQ